MGLPSWLFERTMSMGVFSAEHDINQVAVNEYLGTAGIAAHVEDTQCFGANLATLSLLAPIQLTLIPASMPEIGNSHNGKDHGNWLKVLLEPRSFLALQGDSRYLFRHGVRRSKMVSLQDGSTLRRDANYRRLSLTFRELLKTRRQLEPGPEDQTWVDR